MDFPKEIIEDFLMRLPVKVLTTFKCVSKDWNDLISDSSFRTCYFSRQQSKHKPTGFICHTDMYTNKFFCTSNYNCEKEEVESINNLNKFGCVLAASKGLLLLNDDTRKRLYVYDLVSKKHVKLSRNFRVQDYDYLGFKCQEKIIDRRRCRLCYKVVCKEKPSLSSLADNSRNNVEVYSSDIGTWQKSTIKGKLPFILPCVSLLAKVIGGVFHWYLSYLNQVIAYDCDDPKGRLVTIQLPSKDSYLQQENEHAFEETKDGSLQLITNNNMVVDVWILQNTGGRSYLDEDVIDAEKWNLSSSVNLWDMVKIYIGRGLGSSFDTNLYIIGADPTDAQIIYLIVADCLYAYNYYEGKIVLANSQTIVYEAQVFVRFEWPTWPCL